MLWLSGSVPDSGHLELQTKEPKQLPHFLCGLLNTAGWWAAETQCHCDVPPLKEEVSVGRGLPGLRNPLWMGDGTPMSGAQPLEEQSLEHRDTETRLSILSTHHCSSTLIHRAHR